MVRNFKIRYNGLAEALYFNILCIVLADGYLGIDDLRYLHHNVCYLCAELTLLSFKLRELLSLLCYLFL